MYNRASGRHFRQANLEHLSVGGLGGAEGFAREGLGVVHLFGHLHPHREPTTHLPDEHDLLATSRAEEETYLDCGRCVIALYLANCILIISKFKLWINIKRSESSGKVYPPSNIGSFGYALLV